MMITTIRRLKTAILFRKLIPYRHLPCIAHTIQLLVHPICKKYYNRLLANAS